MKFVLTFVSICMVASAFAENQFGFSDAQLEVLKNVDIASLPAAFHVGLKSDNSHWCCGNLQELPSIQRTKVEKTLHTVATKVKTGYTNCGIMGLDRCTLYQTRYRQEAKYHIATYEVPDSTQCADHHVICCEGYIEVAGNCFDISVIGDNIDVIQQLIDMGLIATIYPGGMRP